MNKAIKHIGIVGCGGIAGFNDDSKRRHIYTHAKAISKIDRLSLSACCDTNETQLNAFANKWKVPNRYTDLQEMLLKEQLDILVIATPTDLHYEQVLLGLPTEVIFCEKPLTWNIATGIKIVKKAEKANTLLVVNHMRRWDSFYAECKSLLDSGELGRIETIATYVDTALYMNSSHMIDMILYFGGDVHLVAGLLDRLNETRIVHGKEDPGAMAMIEHKNGIITFLKATGESRKNHFFELDFQCTKGRLRILDDDMRYQVYKFYDSSQHEGLDELVLDYVVENSYKDERVVNAYLDILAYLDTKKKPLFTAKDALKSLEVINLIYESDSKLVVHSRLG